MIRTRRGRHFDVQVKSFRLETGKSTPYIFLQKRKFEPHPSLLLVLVQFVNQEPPTLYLLRSSAGKGPNPLFESRDYGDGRKSPPEWGLTLSKKKLAALCRDCSFETAIKRID